MSRWTTDKQAYTFLDPSVVVDASVAVEPSFALDIRDVVFRVDELDAVGTVEDWNPCRRGFLIGPIVKQDNCFKYYVLQTKLYTKQNIQCILL